jgi:hypothetical protein
MKNKMVATVLVLCCFTLLTCPGLASDDDRPQVASVSTVAPIGSQGTRAPGSLTTLFASNNGFAGNTMDFTPARNLEFTAIDVNVDSPGITTLVDVYYMVGSCVGLENTASAWMPLASGSGTSAGTDLPTFIDLPGAAGATFATGQVHGFYVDISNYNPPRIKYTNGQWTYSNADISLTTNTGQASPAFTGSFFPRAWNGTIYYDDGGPNFPRVDIKCNDGDAGVTMYAGADAKVDYVIYAGIGQGINVDIWIIAKGPFGWACYNMLGPYGGWNLGHRDVFYTGPLTDMVGKCHLGPLDVGLYKVYLGIETKPNGVLDKGAFYTHDMVDVDVQAPPKVYMWDDGSTENLLCWTAGGEICWLNRFTAYTGGETIIDMHCLFGSLMYPGYAPGNGTVTDCYVWNDPTNDGDPSDAALISTENIVVANVDTDIYNVYPLTNPAVISGEFFVGCNMPHAPSQFCAPIDQTTPYVAGDSFYCGDDTGAPFDPKDLMNNSVPPTEWSNYFCIRAGY